MTDNTNEKTDRAFLQYAELLDDSQAEDCVTYVAFRVEDAMYKRIMQESDFNISWQEFTEKIRKSAELASLVDDIIVRSLDDVKPEQYDFEQTGRPIAWFIQTSQDFRSFIKLSPNKRTTGYVYIVMYWAERVFYDRAGGLKDKEMWLKFCNEIIQNQPLRHRIYRGFLHTLVGIDFNKYIPDTDTLLSLFQQET